MLVMDSDLSDIDNVDVRMMKLSSIFDIVRADLSYNITRNDAIYSIVP